MPPAAARDVDDREPGVSPSRSSTKSISAEVASGGTARRQNSLGSSVKKSAYHADETCWDNAGAPVGASG